MLQLLSPASHADFVLKAEVNPGVVRAKIFMFSELVAADGETVLARAHTLMLSSGWPAGHAASQFEAASL